MKSLYITIFILSFGLKVQAQTSAIELQHCISTTIGDTIIYNILASGNSSLTYQWYCDGKAIEGAIANQLLVDAKSYRNASFYCLISNEKAHVSLASPLALYKSRLDGNTLVKQKSEMSDINKRFLAGR